MRPALLSNPRRYGRLRFAGKPDDVLAQIRAVIAAEERHGISKRPEPFTIHPEVAERMERVNG